MLKYTHKSGGKVSKNIVLVVHVCFLFPSKALNWLLFVIEFGTSLIKKAENDMWVTGWHVPYDKISIKLF